MPVTYRILPQRNLVIVTLSGHVDVAEARASFLEFAADPRKAPGQNHLCDLSGVTGWDLDYVDNMALQAQVADAVVTDGEERLLVILAPRDELRPLASVIDKSWTGLGPVIPVICRGEAEAMHILGQPEKSLAALPPDRDRVQPRR